MFAQKKGIVEYSVINVYIMFLVSLSKLSKILVYFGCFYLKLCEYFLVMVFNMLTKFQHSEVLENVHSKFILRPSNFMVKDRCTDPKYSCILIFGGNITLDLSVVNAMLYCLSFRKAHTQNQL